MLVNLCSLITAKAALLTDNTSISIQPRRNGLPPGLIALSPQLTNIAFSTDSKELRYDTSLEPADET